MTIEISHTTSGLRRRHISKLSRILAALIGFMLVAPVAAQQTSDEESETAIDEIVVTATGTSIRGAAPVGSKVIAVDREQIVNVGASNLADLLTVVPQMDSFGSAPEPFLNGHVQPAINAALRNLGPAATLVLIDGHRVSSSETLQSAFDISSIPQAAIERIEIVTEGWSAINGSDAVAGVVNIITRRNFNGSETMIRGGWGEHGHRPLDISQIFGKTYDRGSAMVTLSYSETDLILNEDLPFRVLDQTSRGGIDTRPINCPQPNMVVGPDTYAAPDYTTLGVTYCDPEGGSSTYSDTKRYGIVGNASYDFTDKLTGRMSGFYNETEQVAVIGAGGLTLTIPDTNPYFMAPPGVTATSVQVLHHGVDIAGRRDQLGEGETGQFVGEFDYDLGTAWQAKLSFVYGWGNGVVTRPEFNAGVASTAAAATTLETAWDPFGNGTSEQVIFDFTNQFNVFAGEQSTTSTRIQFDGPVFETAGGEVKVAIGAEDRTETYEAFQTVGRAGLDENKGAASIDRDATSIFAEVVWPIVGEGNAMTGVQSLTLSAAVRYDDFNDFGSTTNPKFGISWQLTESLAVRANYSEAFHAPGLGDLTGVDTRAIFIPNWGLVPPGSPPLNSIAIPGGRPELLPETAETYSFGFDWIPESLPGFSASATYYDITYENRIDIGPFISGEIFTNPAFSDLVIMNPTQAAIDEIVNTFRLFGFTDPLPPVDMILDLRRTNLGGVHTDGIDFSARYDWATDLGSWAANISGNRLLNLESKGSSSDPFVPNDRTVDWKIRGGISLIAGSWSIDTNVSYLDGYEHAYTTTAGDADVQNVDSFLTFDARAAYSPERDGGFLDGTTFSITGQNLFGESPPFQFGGDGYSERASLYGRVLWLAFQKDLAF